MKAIFYATRKSKKIQVQCNIVCIDVLIIYNTYSNFSVLTTILSIWLNMIFLSIHFSDVYYFSSILSSYSLKNFGRKLYNF